MVPATDWNSVLTCVPFPLPGGPSKIALIPARSGSYLSRGCGFAAIVPHSNAPHCWKPTHKMPCRLTTASSLALECAKFPNFCYQILGRIKGQSLLTFQRNSRWMDDGTTRRSCRVDKAKRPQNPIERERRAITICKFDREKHEI